MKKRNENAPSTMRRNVGCKEEPGLRIFAINESSDGEPSVISVVGAMGKSNQLCVGPKKGNCGHRWASFSRLTRLPI